MIEEALLYHAVMIKLFLVMLFVNLFVPSLFKGNRVKEIKLTRITFFLFSALLSMVAFTGIILYMLARLSWSHGMSLMVAVFFVLAALEIARSQKLKKVWISGESGVAFSWRYVLLEIAVTAAMVLVMVWEKKNAVSVL